MLLDPVRLPCLGHLFGKEQGTEKRTVTAGNDGGSAVLGTPGKAPIGRSGHCFFFPLFVRRMPLPF
ncbi:MAG: hypothetical protein ACOWYE_14455, partial [Desulfatiglandales bacterium]